MADLNQALKLLGNAATEIAVCSVSFIVLTSSCGTGEKEDRIQKKTLPPVATSVLCVPSMGAVLMGFKSPV